jgi:hypothetical protein
MKRVIACAITLLCVACGGSGDEAGVGDESKSSSAPAASAANAAPEIVSAALEPSPAGASDPLTVAVVAKDANRDRVNLTIEWYRNGELVPDLTETHAPAGSFARGDRVYAIVYASDGKDEVSHQTSPVTLGNSAPTLRRVGISPQRATSLDLLQAEADVVDEDGDPIELQYRWLRNGQPLAEVSSPRLEPGVGHRAEVIVVQVRASDGNDQSPWVASAPLTIANAAPAITTQPNYTLTGSAQYSYEVAAKDPDGDRPLKYELVQGPPGMVVDIVNGRVTWRVPPTAKGTYPIELAVSDPYGGKTTQSYSLSVGWSEAPASASDSSKAAPSGAPKATNGKPASASARGAAERDEDYTDSDQDEEAVDDEP